MSGESVLVVEDEAQLADLYADWLADAYDVTAVNSGSAALDRVDDDTDVVLLDRRMDEVSGDEVATRLRERTLDCQVAMVTAVDPGFDLATMPVDDYLVKPVGSADLHTLVERLLRCATLDERRRELSSKRVRRNVLEVEMSPAELAASDDFQALVDRIEELERELDELERELDELGGADAVRTCPP